MTDKRVSSVASLTLPAISTPAALLYPGTDVSVVHGDQQLHVDQNRIMKVDMNHDVTIGMNEVYLVDMNRSMTVMQNYTRNVLMNSTIDVTGNYTKNVLSDYTKTITGISTNTILSDYFKTVHSNYSKSILGSSDNSITGNYTKKVDSQYVKHVTGTATNTIIGDYSKNLMANYSKSVTGNSNITVKSQSVESYIGDHSRTFSSDHKSYIAGSNTHTTIGPTIRSEIGATVTHQNDGHVDSHSDNLTQQKNHWFTTAAKKGTAQGLKIDYSGLALTGAGLKIDTNALNFGINTTTNAIFVHKGDFGVIAQKNVIFKEDMALFKTAVGVLALNTWGLATKTAGATVHAGATGVKFLGGIFQAVGAKVQAGVTWAFNQFM